MVGEVQAGLVLDRPVMEDKDTVLLRLVRTVYQNKMRGDSLKLNRVWVDHNEVRKYISVATRS